MLQSQGSNLGQGRDALGLILNELLPVVAQDAAAIDVHEWIVFDGAPFGGRGEAKYLGAVFTFESELLGRGDELIPGPGVLHAGQVDASLGKDICVGKDADGSHPQRPRPGFAIHGSYLEPGLVEVGLVLLGQEGLDVGQDALSGIAWQVGAGDTEDVNIAARSQGSFELGIAFSGPGDAYNFNSNVRVSLHKLLYGFVCIDRAGVRAAVDVAALVEDDRNRVGRLGGRHGLGWGAGRGRRRRLGLYRRRSGRYGTGADNQGQDGQQIKERKQALHCSISFLVTEQLVGLNGFLFH